MYKFIELECVDGPEDSRSFKELINISNISSIIQITYYEDDDITKLVMNNGKEIWAKVTYDKMKEMIQKALI